MAVFESTGNISTTVTEFQAALGEPNNGNASGPIAGGRRQINWDANIVPFDMPADFFNKTVTRGAELSTPDNSEFFVSNPDPTDPGAPDDRFDSINPTYADQFKTFSDFRLITGDSNVMEVKFFVPGTDIPATVNGFGAVFTDVDLSDSTKINYFDIDGNLIESEYVDPDPEGLSFLGATFEDSELYRVEITSGNTPIGPNDDPENGIDIVVMDDFLFGEPVVAAPQIGDDENNVLTGTPDGDFIEGLGGDDTILLFGGNDFADGGIGNDVVSGGDGDDILNGGAGDDTLIGGKGDDTKNGGAGRDTIIWNNGDGSDLIDGGDGIDTVEVNGAPGAGDEFSVQTLEGSNQVFFERTNLGLFDLTISNTELLEVNGGSGDDTLSVDDLSITNLETVIFNGDAGDDILEGSLTSTSIQAEGGDGNDQLTGGDGSDTLRGGSGDDFLRGGNGADTLVGNSGDDTLQGGNGPDNLIGGSGRDTAEFNNIPFAIAADLVRGTASYEVAPGTVVIDTLNGIENLSGSLLNDDLRGNGAANVLEGNDGDDLLIGRSSNDTLTGGLGSDTLAGGVGNDSLNEGIGNGVLFGGGGQDILNGGVGNDTLLGGAAADTFKFDASLIDGQADVDVIRGFQSIDSLDFSEFLGAGGTIAVNRVAERLLQIELSGEDTVNVFGNNAALNTAETQLAVL